MPTSVRLSIVGLFLLAVWYSPVAALAGSLVFYIAVRCYGLHRTGEWKL